MAETAEGAQVVSEETMKLLGHGNITTACSAVVNYIEKYNPELISQMLPVISTMTIFNKEEVVIFDEVEDSLIHMNPSLYYKVVVIKAPLQGLYATL